TCQTACSSASSATGSLGYFSASSRNLRAISKRCLYARPTNFSRSSSVSGTPLLPARSASLRSALNCSAGVGGLSWPLPGGTHSTGSSMGTRPASNRCMSVSPLFPRRALVADAGAKLGRLDYLSPRGVATTNLLEATIAHQHDAGKGFGLVIPAAALHPL